MPITTAALPQQNTTVNNKLHPCLRVFGKCNFGKKCKFANIQSNCCLSFLKGGICKSKSCSYPHISLNAATATKAVPSCIHNNTNNNNQQEEELNEINDLMMILSPSLYNDDDQQEEEQDDVFNMMMILSSNNDGNSNSINNNNTNINTISPDLDQVLAPSFFEVDSKTDDDDDNDLRGFDLFGDDDTSSDDNDNDDAVNDDDQQQQHHYQDALLPCVGSLFEDNTIDEDSLMIPSNFFSTTTTTSNNKTLSSHLQEKSSKYNHSGNYYSSSSSPAVSSSSTILIMKELEDLKRKCAALKSENDSLVKRHANTTQEKQKQFDARIKAEQDKNSKMQKELDEAKHQLTVQQDAFRLFQEQLPNTIISKFMSANNMSNNNNHINTKNSSYHNHTIKSSLSALLESEIKSLREKVEVEALSLRRMTLLSKVFDLASERFNTQKTSCARSYSPLVPNECLFSEFSPVAQMFFKACPDNIFAKELFNTPNGEFNSKRFEIVFHGTRGAVPASKSIQCGGFDPKRRSGQALGPGEYSSCHLSTAMGYSGGAVLATLAYMPDAPCTLNRGKNNRGSRYSAEEYFGPVAKYSNGVFVIDNPKDHSSTYMLPLGCSYDQNNYQVKNASFLRSCSCAQKQAAKALEEFTKHKDSINNNNNDFKGKKVYFKEAATRNNNKEKTDNNNNNNQYQQLNADSSSYLLNILYNKKNSLSTATPSTIITNNKNNTKNKKNTNATTTNNKSKKSKKNQQQQQTQSASPRLFYTMMKGENEEEEKSKNKNKEGEACSVDLQKLEMTNLKSGKVYKLAIWS